MWHCAPLSVCERSCVRACVCVYVREIARVPRHTFYDFRTCLTLAARGRENLLSPETSKSEKQGSEELSHTPSHYKEKVRNGEMRALVSSCFRPEARARAHSATTVHTVLRVSSLISLVAVVVAVLQLPHKYEIEWCSENSARAMRARRRRARGTSA